MKCIAYCGVVLMMLLAMISVFLIGNNPETIYNPARVAGQTSFVPSQTGAPSLPKAVYPASFQTESAPVASNIVLKAHANGYLDVDPNDFRALQIHRALVLDAETEPGIAVNSPKFTHLRHDQPKPETPQPNFIEATPGKHLPYGKDPHYTRLDFV